MASNDLNEIFSLISHKPLLLIFFSIVTGKRQATLFTLKTLRKLLIICGNYLKNVLSSCGYVAAGRFTAYQFFE